jgi:hypothetical protein
VSGPSPGPEPPSLTDQLFGHALRLWPTREPEARRRLHGLVERAVEQMDEKARGVFIVPPLEEEEEEARPEVIGQLRESLGIHALAEAAGHDDTQHVRDQIGSMPAKRLEQLFNASIRGLLGILPSSQHQSLQQTIGELGIRKATGQMATPTTTFSYSVDKSSLGASFDDATFIQDVTNAISGLGVGTVNSSSILVEGIIGMLLLDGNTDPGAPSFGDQISNRLWNYIQAPLVDSNGQRIDTKTNRDAFTAVDNVIQQIRGGTGAYYQELATASRQIIDSQRGAIIGDAKLLPSAVTQALQGYGAGTSTTGSFDLPPLTGVTTGGGTDEIDPDHIRGVSMLYAAFQLDVLGIIKVVDRNVEIFMNGLLPVSNDLAGNALNAYYWDTVNRMSESARWMQYSRVFGAKGGEVSKEVQPNTAFDDLMLHFLSSLAEYNRQQATAALLGNNRALSLNAEGVREAGRRLAANCTLYGYGYTQFAAKRLQQHIQTVLNILKLRDIQNAWGVQSAWQVVERVSSQEFKTTPNVVKYRTMAESGKAVLDLVAKNASAWTATTGNPLFSDDGDDEGVDIKNQDRDQLMRHTEYWLAVNGVKDMDVAARSQPSDTAYSPSIPSLDGTGTSTGTDLAGQIQNMLQSGQTPSADQLRHMVGI